MAGVMSNLRAAVILIGISGYLVPIYLLLQTVCPTYQQQYLIPDAQEQPDLALSIPVQFDDFRFTFHFTRLPRNFFATCSGSNSSSPLPLLVIVLSSPRKSKIRDAIRSTWASASESNGIKNGDAMVFFLVGNGNSESEELAREADLYNDIISVDLEDHYMNLMYKVHVILHIAYNLCSPTFVLKIDEDVVFHIDRFLKGVDKVFVPSKSSIYCNVWHNMAAKRNRDDKWYITSEQFPGSKYPPFCSGSSYVLTTKAAGRLLYATKLFPIIRVEDVLFTGLIANAAGVGRVNLPNMFHKEPTLYKGCPKTAYSVRSLISKHKFSSPEAIASGWRYMAGGCPKTGPGNSTVKGSGNGTSARTVTLSAVKQTSP